MVCSCPCHCWYFHSVEAVWLAALMRLAVRTGVVQPVLSVPHGVIHTCAAMYKPVCTTHRLCCCILCGRVCSSITTLHACMYVSHTVCYNVVHGATARYDRAMAWHDVPRVSIFWIMFSFPGWIWFSWSSASQSAGHHLLAKHFELYLTRNNHRAFVQQVSSPRLCSHSNTVVQCQ